MRKKPAAKRKPGPVPRAAPAVLPAALLDALPASAALLDPRGVIVAVNRAWRRFAKAGKAADSACGVGRDYLAVCARARGAFSAEAAAAAAGIRRVLAGRAREFTLEYPCHAPAAPRWFRLVASPVRLAGGTGALVIHVDITELKLTGEERLRLADNLAERVKELRALHETSRLIQLEGLDVAGLLERFVALLPAAMQFPEIAAARVRFGREVRATPGFRRTVWRLEEDFATAGGIAGRLEVVYLKKRPLLADGPFFREERQLLRSLAEMLRAHFERQEVEADLRATQLRQQHILDAMEEGIHGLDREGRIIFENPAAAALFGWKRSDLIGRPAHELVHHHRADGSPYPVADCPIYRTLRDGVVRRVEDEVFFRQDGSSFPVEYVCSPVRDAAGAITGAVVCFRDVTARRRALEALRESQAIQRIAGRVARLGGWQVDLPAMKLTWSEEVSAIHETPPGFTPGVEEAINFYAPEFRERIRHRFKACAERGSPYDEELQIITAKGRRIWVRSIAEAVRDEAGRITRVQGAFQDITERKQAESEVLRLAERLTTTLESITDAFYTVGRDWHFTYLNRRAEQLLQRSREDLLGRDVWREFPAAVGTVFEQEFRRALAQGVSVGFEAYYPQPLDLWFEVMAYPSEEGLAVYFRDITAARLAREELRLSEQRFREMAENIGDIFYNYDPGQNRLLYVSPAAERIMGRPLQDLYARASAYLDWTHPEDRPAAEAAFARQQAGEETIVGFRIIRPDGSECWVREHAVPVKRADGRVDRIVGTIRDITERRRAAEEIRRHNETLTGIVETLQAIAAHDRTVPELMTLMAERAQALTGAEGGVVELIDGAELVYTAASGAATSSLGLRLPASGSLTGRAMSTGAALLCEDTETDDRVDREACRLAGIRSMVVAPLRDGARALGALKVMSSRPRAFTARDGQNLQILVESLGAVIQRQAAAEQVRTNEERFRLLARATTDAVWDWDLTAGTVWWNEGYETIFGRRRDEVPPTAASWTDFIHPDDAARVTAGIHAVIDGGGSEWTDEYRFRCKDGRHLHVLDRGHVIRDAAGRAVRMIGGMTDLTERRRIEDKLREQAALLDKANDAILVRDLDHRILFWNRSAERLYGWTAGEALGRRVQELFYDTTEAFEQAHAELLAQGEWSGELAQRTKDGRPLTVDCRWTLVCDPAGRPESILAINTDVTERKHLEAQFLRAQRMESIGTLAGGIAHDLNNLLAPILMGAELLQRQALTDPGREILHNIERSARRSTELVRQVLSFARGIEGERIPLQIRHIVREVEDIIASTFPRNIELDVSLPKDLWLVPGDATQLNQVLLNLCVNARDAMPDGGRLTLAAENRTLDAQYAATDGTVPAGDYVLVEVTDTGCGMSREVQERIFEPFFTTKALGKGTGLGLSTVIGIVRSHGGAVTVQSALRRGSTFRVWLPAQPAAAAAEPAATTQAPAVRTGRGELILLVDDEAGVLDITQQTLEAFGYRVIAAHDGAHAVGLFAVHQAEVAVVLTDLMMPVMDGPALIAALQRIQPGVRIVAATGVNTGDYMTRAVALGVKHFLAKPFTAQVLLDKLHEVLAAAPAGGSRPPLEPPAP